MCGDFMGLVVKKELSLNNDLINFVVDESFDLFCKIKNISTIEYNLIVLKERLKKCYVDSICDYACYSARIDKMIVGILLLKEDNYISDLFVKKEYRKNGIGTLLLNEVLKEDKEFTLDTTNDLASYYFNFGFEILSKGSDKCKLVYKGK